MPDGRTMPTDAGQRPKTATLSTPGAEDSPRVVVRPPLLYLAALLAGIAIDYFWPASLMRDATQYMAGPSLVVGGLALALAAMGRFRAADTNIPTPLPATALVTDGVYTASRNPIYLGLTLLYLGIGFTADNLWIIALVAPVLAVMRYGVIAREERYLEAKFADAYREYCARVRRWL